MAKVPRLNAHKFATKSWSAREEILAEIAKGWSARAIWEVLTESKEITCSYKTFIGHVHRLQIKAPASARLRQKKKRTLRGIQHRIRRS